MSTHVVFLFNLAPCLYMTGLIWFVQLVHYPLFLRISPGDFIAYERTHQRLTTYAVAPAMLMELAASLWWIASRPESGFVWCAGALTGINWLSTFALQVPLHNRLSQRFSQSDIERLVATNWIRTAAWTARSLLLLSLL